MIIYLFYLIFVCVTNNYFTWHQMKSVQLFSRFQSITKLSYQFCQNSEQPPLTPEQAQSLIQKWTKNNKICLFMKGNPSSPRCGYSKLMVEILKFYGL